MKTLLIIEDDTAFAAGLVRTLSRRGFSCFLASSCAEAMELARQHSPLHVLADLNLGNETTQELIPQLRTVLPVARIVILTGYGTVPSAVQALKGGADHYLCKPATPDVIVQTLLEAADGKETPAGSLWDLENEHILKVLDECGGNISQAAKNLGLHRRTLQRRLKKI